MKKKHAAVLGCSVIMGLPLGCLANPPAGMSPRIAKALDALGAVHPLSEAAISPDGEHVVYGSVAAGNRNGAQVDVTALWFVDATDGSGATRVTACPGSACDEHGVAWSTDGT